MPSLLILPFSKEEQNQWCQVTEMCQTFLMVSVAYDQGRIESTHILANLEIVHGLKRLRTTGIVDNNKVKNNNNMPTEQVSSNKQGK